MDLFGRFQFGGHGDEIRGHSFFVKAADGLPDYPVALEVEHLGPELVDELDQAGGVPSRKLPRTACSAWRLFGGTFSIRIVGLH